LRPALIAISPTAIHREHRRHAGRENNAVAEEQALWDLGLGPSVGGRGAVGGATLPVDPGTVARFLAKCAPVDDDGHRWWLGAVDGGADLSGGYGRFQAGSGLANLVTTTAHRYASTVADGPIPPGIVVRHRCDEPLCTAELHLERGTVADNRWDAVTRPHRAADLDTRGSADRSRAVRTAVLAVLSRGVTNPEAIGAAARAAMALGDPYRDQLVLWTVSDLVGGP
jgi:hypothetical protein